MAFPYSASLSWGLLASAASALTSKLLQVWAPKCVESIKMPTDSQSTNVDNALVLLDQMQGENSGHSRGLSETRSQRGHESAMDFPQSDSRRTFPINFPSNDLFHDELWPYSMTTNFPLIAARDDLEKDSSFYGSRQSAPSATDSKPFSFDYEDYTSAAEEFESDSDSYISAVEDTVFVDSELEWEDEESVLILDGSNIYCRNLESSQESSEADTAYSEFTLCQPIPRNDEICGASDSPSIEYTTAQANSEEADNSVIPYDTEKICTPIQNSHNNSFTYSPTLADLHSTLIEVFDLDPKFGCDGPLITSALAAKGYVLNKFAEDLVQFEEVRGFERLQKQFDDHVSHVIRNSETPMASAHSAYIKNLNNLVRKIKQEISQLKEDSAKRYDS